MRLLIALAGLAIGFDLPAFADKADQSSRHIIGTAGNEARANGEWTVTLKGEKFGPVEAKGNWLEIYRREGDTWKKRLDMWNVTPAPAK